MTQLATIDPKIKTMTSREIAELTGKAHKNVLADIRELLGALGLAVADFSAAAQVPGPNNSTRTIEVINLPKRECLILVSGYSIAMRARIIDRWQELETKAAEPALPALPRTFSEALRALADKTDLADQQAAALALAAPKAAALDLISAGHDAVTITEAAKVLGIKRAVLVARMHADSWIYRQNQSWVAYDQHIKNGRLQYKEARYTDEKTGMECVKPYCHVTPKGLARLAQVFAVEVVA